MKPKSILPKAFFSFNEMLLQNINPFNIVTLKRNISSYPFSHKLCKAQSKEIVRLVSKAFKKASHIKPHYYPSKKLTVEERALLLEHFMLEVHHNSQELDELFILDDQGQFLAQINAQNHLHLHHLTDSQNLKKAFDTLFHIEEELSQNLTFSFNKKFGYLTSNPHESGTGLICSSYLHLPALIHAGRLDLHKEKINPHIEVLGMNTKQEYIADLVHIKNKCTLGLLEKNILADVQKTKDMLIQMESKERDNLKASKDSDIKNKISRAFGLLSCASKLNTQETLNALSLIELGKSLKWIDGLEKSDFSSLFFKTQRAHLPFFSKNIDEMQITRAKLLHQELKSAKLSL